MKKGSNSAQIHPMKKPPRVVAQRKTQKNSGSKCEFDNSVPSSMKTVILQSNGMISSEKSSTSNYRNRPHGKRNV